MATKFITATANKIAHALRRVYPQLSWGEAFRLAVRAEGAGVRDAMRVDSVFGVWRKSTQEKVAEQMFAIAGAYGMLGDKGRARSFSDFGLMLSRANRAEVMGGFADMLAVRGVGEGIMLEVVEMFAKSRMELRGEEALTERQLALRGALFQRFLAATSKGEAERISEAAYRMSGIHWWCCADDLDNEGVPSF